MNNNEIKKSNVKNNNQEVDYLNLFSWISVPLALLVHVVFFPIGLVLGYMSMNRGGKGKVPMIVNAVGTAFLIFMFLVGFAIGLMFL